MPKKFNPLVPPFDYYEEAGVETDPVFGASEAANFVAGDKNKLDGIEAGAEVNNISDVNATDLTDAGATTLHKHDHGGMDGLTDDDHTQYVKKAGDTLSGNLDFAKYKAVAMACDNGATLPASPVAGQWYLHTPTGRKVLMQYDGTNWIPILNLGTTTIYVDGASGTDSLDLGGATGAGAFATIQYAIDSLAGLIGGNVTINIASGTYTETATIQGKNPTGNFTITLNGTQTIISSHTVGVGNLQGIWAANEHQYAKVVRGSGTWTVNEVQNKFVIITSGNNNGEYLLIDSNTTTEIRPVGRFASGAFVDSVDTFNIVEPGTTISNFIVAENQKGIIVNDIALPYNAILTYMKAYSVVTYNRCVFNNSYGTNNNIFWDIGAYAIFRSCYFYRYRVFVRGCGKGGFDACKWEVLGLQFDEGAILYMGGGNIVDAVTGVWGSSLATANLNGTSRAAARNIIRGNTTGAKASLNAVFIGGTTTYGYLFWLPGDDIMPNALEQTTATSANKLVDSSVNFTTIGVAIGDKVVNITDKTTALVTAIDSTTQLSLDTDIMASGEAYRILSASSLNTTDSVTETGGQF